MPRLAFAWLDVWNYLADDGPMFNLKPPHLDKRPSVLRSASGTNFISPSGHNFRIDKKEWPRLTRRYGEAGVAAGKRRASERLTAIVRASWERSEP